MFLYIKSNVDFFSLMMLGGLMREQHALLMCGFNWKQVVTDQVISDWFFTWWNSDKAATLNAGFFGFALLFW